MNDYFKSGLTVVQYCENVPVSDQSLHRWVKASKEGEMPKKKQYSSIERKEAVEQFLKSGLAQEAFAKTWGIHAKTLSKWYVIYRELGPQALVDGKMYGEGKKRGRKGIKQKVKEIIIETKMKLPEYGLKKLRDFMYRFEGVKVSPNTIKKVLVEEDIFNPPTSPPKRKSPPQPRRFERANPMQLWQSDITSYVLKRTGQRVYLVVFKDDHSRYIVSWALALKQTGKFVMECFLDGTQKFGKPEETLTDQGRQYFSWRGKSEFQKLLENEGVKHVVSRSHHPQTLGKCERLWKTIGIEFWNRARPEELSEARERLGHFINHYNHFRPHQGIDGMTPADRFFGVEKDVRESIEKNLTENELLLSIEQKPRKPFFFVGQVGDKRITIHGEGGKLQVNTPDGESERIDYEDFGNGNTKSSRNSEPEGRDCIEQKKRTSEEAEFQSTESSDSHKRTMGIGDDRTTEDSASSGHHDNGILDGPDDENGSIKEVRSNPSSDLAIEPTGDFGDVCRTFKTTEENDYDKQRERPKIFEEEDSRTGRDDRYSREIDYGLEGDARMQASDLQRSDSERRIEEEEKKESEKENRSETWQEAKDRNQEERRDTQSNSKSEWWNNFLKKKDE